MKDYLSTGSTLDVGGHSHHIASLKKFETITGLHDVPVTIRILLENLLRRHLLGQVTRAELDPVVAALRHRSHGVELTFAPSRVLLQDASGIPVLVDLAAMREAVSARGQQAAPIEPVIPCTLVVDHSVQVDVSGTAAAFEDNLSFEYHRHRERYEFLRWAQQAFDNVRVVPPGKGIVHQINLEHLAQVVTAREIDGQSWAFPDTLFGTDSHTTMVNGLGVLGWGVGGIEAESAMLGEPSSMLIPQVVGVNLTGRLPEGATATDLVLTLTKILRGHNVVGKFVEFHGDGLRHLSLADRATLGNMSPEYGSTCAFFPTDEETIRYLQLTGRSDAAVALVEAYAREQGLWRDAHMPDLHYDSGLTVDLASVEPCLAGPRLPQEYVPLGSVRASYRKATAALRPQRAQAPESAPTRAAHAVHAAHATHVPGVVARSPAALAEKTHHDGPDSEAPLADGAVVIAAITSCTNTSNPMVMLAAGLLARNAAARGLRPKPWVKTSMAPGSRVVTHYLDQAGLTPALNALGFYLVGYGCTTCVGNSGDLLEGIAEQVRTRDLVVASVLSGNRNFSGRIHSLVRLNYLASPPLVVAYALAGTLDVDLAHDPLGTDDHGQAVYLRDLWPSNDEVARLTASVIAPDMFRRNGEHLYEGDAHWDAIPALHGTTFPWRSDSSYFKRPPYFDDPQAGLQGADDIMGARCLALFGDSITTDHISPIGVIDARAPAAQYLRARGIQERDFNSYGSRRGNHDVMVRGTFANIRIRNLMRDGVEGGTTVFVPTGEAMSIFDAAEKYGRNGTPLVIVAGSQYGTGSARDWAAKGTALLGVRAIIAKSFERIHRSNLIGMGVLPLQFMSGEDAATLGLTGHESFDIQGLQGGAADEVTIVARDAGEPKRFRAQVMLQTARERDYYRAGGILHFILHHMAR